VTGLGDHAERLRHLSGRQALAGPTPAISTVIGVSNTEVESLNVVRDAHGRAVTNQRGTASRHRCLRLAGPPSHLTGL
jgi:hypothetical protein